MKCSGPCGKQYPYTEIVISTRYTGNICKNYFLLDRAILQSVKDQWIADGRPHILPPVKRKSKHAKTGQMRLFE